MPPPQLYVKAPVPPIAVILIAPVEPLLHPTLVTMPEIEMAVGSVIVALVTKAQFLKSVTVTE